MNASPLRLLPLVLLALATVSFAQTAAVTRAAMEKKLTAESFWQLPLEAWTEQELPVIGDIAASSENRVARLRATKVMIEKSGQGRATAEDVPLVQAAFRYLEGNANHPAVRKLFLAPRMTHYTVSRDGARTAWILLESVTDSPLRGGLNLQWDPTKSLIGSIHAWGGLAP